MKLIGYIIFCILSFNLKAETLSIRPLPKLAEVHEDSSTASTKQFASSVEFGKRSEDIIQYSLPHATVGIVFSDAKTGKIIYQKNADKLFYPASCTKLFLTAALLYKYDQNMRLYTNILRNNNYYIQFNGAPDFTVDSLESMIKKLADLHITTIPDDIILDGQSLLEPNYLPGISYDDIGWYYAAPSSSFVIDDNKEDFDFITAKSPNNEVKIISKSQYPALTIINKLRTVSKEEAKNDCSFDIKTYANNTIQLTGCIRRHKKPISYSFAIPHPEQFIAAKIKSLFKKYKINFSGTIKYGKTPKTAQILVTHASRPIKELIKHMLLESDNLYAANFTKILGDGSLKKGAFAIKSILKQHIPIDTSQIEITDGVGTRFNLSSPTQLITLLNTLNNNDFFLESLPIMGVSGTLKYRMQDTVLKNHVFAKTGSMHDISSLAGYLYLPQGKIISFAIMINGINTSIVKAKELEDKILLSFAENTQ